MMGFRVLLIKELREQVRTGRLIAVGAVFVLFGILGPLTDRYMKELMDAVGTQSGGFTVTVPPPSLQGALTQIVKNLSQFGVICGLLLAMGSVSWEKDRGTAGMIITKPASRAAFLAAKLVVHLAQPGDRHRAGLRPGLRLHAASLPHGVPARRLRGDVPAALVVHRDLRGDHAARQHDVAFGDRGRGPGSRGAAGDRPARGDPGHRSVDASGPAGAGGAPCHGRGRGQHPGAAAVQHRPGAGPLRS